MGYEVSLRHSEADHIEVVSIDEAKHDAELSKADAEDRQQVMNSQIVDTNNNDELALGDKMLVAEKKTMPVTRLLQNKRLRDFTMSST